MVYAVGSLVMLTSLGLACVGRSPEREPLDAGWNLLLITLDTVRADRLGCYGYSAAETPNLDGLARSGVLFEQVISPAPLTLPAHATALTGLLPPRHGLRENGLGSLPPAVDTLAVKLAAVGYRTGAFVGSFVLDRRFGLDRGFEKYDDEVAPAAALGSGLEAERSGREVVDRALSWLDEGGPEPFFAWVHLYDAHAPYEPPEPWRSRHPDRPYDGELAAVDAQVGRLLRHLGEAPAAERTIVAVAGDHGEALGDHGELTHGFFLYEMTLRVPLLLSAPGSLPSDWRVTAPVGLVDLTPTLAGLLRVPQGPAAAQLDGRDLSEHLLHRQEPPAADLYAETRYPTTFGWSPLASVRRGPWKYIEAPRPELYDLEADPVEKNNQSQLRQSEAAALARRLQELSSATAASVTNQVDEETRTRLAALGYLAKPPRSARSDSDAAADPKDRIGLFRAFEEAHWAAAEGRTSDAATALEELLATDPANPAFRAELARIARQSGDRERAIALYREAVTLAPDDADTWYNLAATLQQLGRHEEARLALVESMQRDPAKPEALNALAIAYVASGRLEEAEAHLTSAVGLAPRDALAWNNLGNVRRDLGKTAGAEAAYRRAIELNPNYGDPLNGLGTLEVARDQPLAALLYFERALAVDPELHEVHLNRGISFELAGDRSAAVASYRQFLESTRDNTQFGDQRRIARELLERLEDSARQSQGEAMPISALAPVPKRADRHVYGSADPYWLERRPTHDPQE